MGRTLVFDVDGTLTLSRQVIDAQFCEYLIELSSLHSIILVTGSDRSKTLEQVGELYYYCDAVYQCAGNQKWIGDELIYQNEWTLPQAERDWLMSEVELSNFEHKTDIHIEDRPGMVNFTILGRAANKEQRAKYVEWDKLTNERRTIAKRFREFSGLECSIGGETGIDIYPKGMNKSQILNDEDYFTEPFIFFGDDGKIGGNDYELAIKSPLFCAVSDWKNTENLLKNMCK